ncbi:MAG: type II toxin-antitoxin system PemK/MazF family toxin [Alphaproteobacteria bacterium]|nr:type II toxin-antitoxin system PemK/MazF family toxin [Alphaproteobacteria bacterium]
MIYKRWDIIAVHFPFLEGIDAKRRPALIISADRLYSEHSLYWIAMITTAKSGQRPKDVAVTNLERAGLPEACVIRVPRLATVSDQQIARRLGDLIPKDRNAVSALLKQSVP